MSRESNKHVDKALRTILAPVLRADGFVGMGRTFRRYRGDLVHVLQVQGSPWGGALSASLGVHLRFLVFEDALPWTWEKIPEFQCFLHQSLGPGPGWRHKDDPDEILAAIQEMRALYESHARAEFERFARWPESFERIPPGTGIVEPELFGNFVCKSAAAFPRIRQRIATLRGASGPRTSP